MLHSFGTQLRGLGAALVAAVIMTLLVAAPSEATVAGQNGRIAFTRDGGVWTMNINGTGARRLTNGSGPTWSPDGTRIAFTRDDKAGGACCPDTNVYVMNADGSGVVRVTSSRDNQFRPVWSPDGSHLAFTADNPVSEGGWDIYLLRSTAPFGVRTRVTRDGGAFLADWSTTGKLLYGCSNQICTVNVNGTGRLQLTSVAAGHGYDNFAGTFSPDGRRIAFSSTRAGNDPAAPQDLWVMNADGSAQKRLTDTQACCLNGDGSPAWSPNGRLIAFSSDRHGPGGAQFDLYSIPAVGGSVTRLTRTATPSEFGPSWQRL
jgi:Tol biopolymer transport system component